MNTLNKEQYDAAIAGWINSCGNYTSIKNLIPTNYVFNFDSGQIDWMKNLNKNAEFCTEIGVYKDQLIAVLCPLDSSGQKIVVKDYPYSVLSELNQDLRLVETEEYTLIKNAVLSKDLRTIDNSSDMYWPIANKPMMAQDKAVEAIESWRNEGMTWFYRECEEFKGSRTFKKFFVPADNLNPPKPGLTNIICSFGLKFSEVYQRVLPTLIFISFYVDIENTGSIETISNTYDWSQACPPLCG
ncbi:hypothetical protein QFZ37_001326 [Chryseobacterium ginsenosidimutans]|uniref:hypothetical protein n=1 Tax=Chryseobacterium ginsenosidimutans TaxID=687846 RepID=UPI0027896EA9|nr:hypothetical protein [Chryseobacterium ginsenosidimutans]MDQ0592957.1 hypothetical protein [Chryseobacterium ginsenosidimutans]